MSDLKKTFNQIYKTNAWDDEESVSGGGSRLDRTEEVREKLPAILRKLGAFSMLDAGCGDWNWMSQVDFGPDLHIHACDIVPEMVKANTKRFKRAQFFTADITQDILPIVDVVVCRTVLFHLSYENVWKALRNFRESGSTYLLTTTHPNHAANSDIQDGDWRRLNLQIAPFYLTRPDEMFADGPGDDGFLALWRLESLL